MANGHPGLLAIEQVSAIRLLYGNARHSIVIGTSTRLRNCRYRNARAWNVVHDIHDLLLLLFVAELNNVHDGVEIGLERQNTGGVLMQLFHKQDQRKLVARNTANLFRKAKMHKAQLAESHSCF